MVFQVKLTKDSLKDINQIKDWYNSKRPILGDRFVSNLEIEIDRISKQPKIFQHCFNEIRRAKIQEFPFCIYYILEETKLEVIVIAILHTSRNPKTWKNRL